MARLPKLICRFNEIPITIQISCFTDLEKRIQEFLWNYKRQQIVKAILRSKNIAAGIKKPDLKLYCRAIVTKAAWF